MFSYYRNFRKEYKLLTVRERITFLLHMGYSATDGFVLGILSLNEFVFLRSMQGSSWQLGFLFQFSVLVYLFLIFISEWLKRVNDKPRLMLWTGAATRLPLLLLLFFPRSDVAYLSNSAYHYIFLVLFLLYYSGNSILFPTINLFLKSIYRHQLFGKLYSHATMVNKIVMMASAFLYGWLLDLDKFAFTWVFFVAALMGFLATVLLSKVPYKAPQRYEQIGNFWQSVRHSVVNLRAIMRNNTPFRHFELGFLAYGFAFMSTITVITIFMERHLGLNYFGIATYKNIYNIIALFMIPYFGSLIGRIDPRRFGAFTFASIAFYLLSLVITYYFPGYREFGGIKFYHGMWLFILFQALFAATMSFLWSIGSAYFCKPEEAGDYQSVHLILTAVRSLFAPFLGVLFFELFGYVFTFTFGAVVALFAVGVMLWSYRRDKRVAVE